MESMDHLFEGAWPEETAETPAAIVAALLLGNCTPWSSWQAPRGTTLLRLDRLAQLSQRDRRCDQVIVKHDSCRLEQVRGQRIAQGVTDGRAQPSAGDDIPHSKNSQLLRDQRLTQLKRHLQFLNTSFSTAEELENAYAYRMSESAEELGFEGLEVRLRSPRHE
jgi:hypothetical protein